MKELAYLYKYFARYKWHLIGGILFVSLSNYFRILQPQMIRNAMNLVFKNLGQYKSMPDGAAKQALYNTLLHDLMYFGGVILLCALLMGLFMYFMRQTIVVMSRLIEGDLREEIFVQYENLSAAFYKKNSTGDMMSRITEDVSKVRMYLGPVILYGVNLISLFALVIYAMFSVNKELAIYSLLPLPILVVSIYYVSDLINKRSGIIQQQLAKLNSIAQETYSGIRVVKSYGQVGAMTDAFAAESEIFKQKSLELARVDALFSPIMISMVGITTIVTIYVGGIQVSKGLIDVGNIAEFVIYISMLTWPVTSIGWIASLIQQAAASQKRINEFLKLVPDVQNVTQAKRTFDGEIEFCNVSFDYPDTGVKALQNVSFKLAAGQKMAIIGRIGSGKTTIADLIVRMYDTTKGQILIDGKDIRTLDLANLRQRVGYVPQDIFLFSDTVAQNVAFGKSKATQSEIETYTKYASIHEEVLELADGYQTTVGERGVTLSGGQKQRLSIARALIKKPDLILLDDCLSAVDTNTEAQIVSYLSNELADKTAMIITHRIYGLLQFDQIIVLDEGRIVEAGTHKELMENGGYYAELFELQNQA